jgi:broad specificity polyphosphatase/5'/3'-nucleotidase SurE
MQSMISAPAENKSGSSSFEFPPIPLISDGEFGTILAGSPPTGPDPSDGYIFYVNSFPATAIEYGIEKLAPDILGGTPDLAVTGPNVGGMCDTNGTRRWRYL